MVVAEPSACNPNTRFHFMRYWLWACVGLLVVAVVRNASPTWLPLGDNALMRMWTDAVGGWHTPLVGGDSRFGWNHLGPWVFYVMAVPYRLLGRSALGLLIGAAAINIVSVVMIVRCARSFLNDQIAALLCAGSLVFALATHGPRLIDPWNPYVGQLPFLLAMVACWAVVAGNPRWLAWLIGAGSFSVQAHLTFLPPVIVLIAIGSFVAFRRRTTLTSTNRRWIVAVTVFAWAPAMVDLVLPRGHNVWRILRFFLGSSGAKDNSGLATSAKVILHETGLQASWLGGQPHLSMFTAGFTGDTGLAPGLGLMALGLAGWLAWRRRDTHMGAFVAMLAVLLIAGLSEMTVASGPMFPYLFGWISIVGMLCSLSPLIVAAHRRSTIGAYGMPALAVAAACALAIAHTGLPRSPRERVVDVAIARQLIAESVSKLDRHQRYQLRHGYDQFNSIYELGLVSELRQRHFDIVVVPQNSVLFGRHMINDQANRYPALEVVAPYDGATRGGRLLASSDPLTPIERSEERALSSTLSASYIRAGHRDTATLVTFDDGSLLPLAVFTDSDPTLNRMLNRLTYLRRQGRPIAVILYDVNTLPHR